MVIIYLYSNYTQKRLQIAYNERKIAPKSHNRIKVEKSIFMSKRVQPIDSII